MKFLLWLLGLFALAVAATLAAHNPGYVVIFYPPYKIPMSLTLFVLLLLALLIFSHLALQLASAALRLPAYVRRFRAERAEAKGHAAMMEGLSAYFEGRYAAAEKAAVRAMELGDQSGINPIVAARSAHELREFDKRDAYLAASEGKTVGEATMRLMAQTKFNLDQQQPQSALNSLKELREAGVKSHVGALHLELRAQQQARNWDAVLDIINQLEKRDAIDTTPAAQMRQQAWLEKIRAPGLDATALQTLWKAMPGEFRQRARIAAAAARAFMQLGDCANARQLLSESLETQWDSELVMLYGDCPCSDAVAQIEQAERWLQQHTHEAALLLTLGKLCLHQQLWGKAQSYLEASISVAPSRAAYTALAQLMEKLHKQDEAFRYYQQAMELAQGD